MTNTTSLMPLLLEISTYAILISTAFLPVTEKQLSSKDNTTSENFFGYLIALWLYLFGYNWYSYGYKANIIPLASFYLTLLIAISFRLAINKNNDALSGMAMMSLVVVVPFYLYAFSDKVFTMSGLWVSLSIVGVLALGFVFYVLYLVFQGMRENR